MTDPQPVVTLGHVVIVILFLAVCGMILVWEKL